jgi:trigger factor
MQVTEVESNGLKKKLQVVVPASQVNEQVEKELRATGEQVKIPGFRPGFIPLKILKQRYGKSVQSEVVKQVINNATGNALSQKKLRPALAPQLSLDSYEEGGDLTFTMTFEAFPEVPDLAFDKITLERNTFDISEEAIDEALQTVAERSPKFTKVTDGSAAKSGNVVVIDFKGMLDGVAFDGGTAKDFRLELGSGQFIEGFEDQLVGAKEGEDRVVNVTFPKQYQAANLAGKPAVFEVKIKEIQGKEAATVDEDFAKQHGFADLAALRDAIRTQLVREYDGLVRNQLKKQLFDVLEEKCTFELPQGMVDMEFNTIWERLKEAQASGDESVSGKSEDDLKTEYRDIAKRRVKLGLLLAEIGNRNKIQISREELSRAVWQQASMFPGQEKKVMEFYRSNPERADDLRGPILEEKAVDFILGKVAFNDKKTTIDELRAESGEDDDGEAKPKKKAKAAKKDTAEGEEAAAPKPKAKKKAAGE